MKLVESTFETRLMFQAFKEIASNNAASEKMMVSVGNAVRTHAPIFGWTRHGASILIIIIRDHAKYKYYCHRCYDIVLHTRDPKKSVPHAR